MDPKELKAIRRHIHQHPELSFLEVETSKFVATKLREFGFDQVVENVARTGVVGVLKSGKGKGAVGLRADMDALPITERVPENDVERKSYESMCKGVHHACGHDGHTTMLLGAAKYLALNRNEFSGTINFIFQPAEEGGAGALVMMNEGLFERFPCREVYGFHNLPKRELGSVDAFPGPRMAAADKFDITITGEGGHAAMPSMCKDPVVVGAQIITALQTIVSRTVSPFDSVVLSVTMLNGSNAHNIIPNTCQLGGTVRTFKPEIRARVKESFNKMVAEISSAMGTSGMVKWSDSAYPALINHVEQTKLVVRAAEKVVGPAKIIRELTDPAPGSEDFAFFLQEKPGCYFFLGGGEGAPLHTPDYNFNDDILEIGSKLFVSIACESLRCYDNDEEVDGMATDNKRMKN